MKKILLAVLSLSMITLLEARSYSELRQDFKDELYERQKGLMPEKRYKNFIEPYIKKAEEKSVIFEYCRENPDSVWVQEFFGILLNYNAMTFHATYVFGIRTHNDNGFGISSYRRQLIEVATHIKEELNKEFNPQEEVRKICDLLVIANKDFYNNLGWTKRAYCAYKRSLLGILIG